MELLSNASAFICEVSAKPFRQKTNAIGVFFPKLFFSTVQLTFCNYYAHAACLLLENKPEADN